MSLPILTNYHAIWLASLRWKYKQEKKFEIADSLRKILLDFGWEVADDKESFSIKPIAQQPPIAPPD